ncbi:hypothetical protein [Actinomadura sp. BRA 177]|uniref:hypothetical protein n=1 Tax=Actinomadura sp. BRA 177 TaxID=2745202 RepID=UPI001C3E8506|nr:hypothetical protein [Actinomadura sp. BRA 177]
MDNYLGRCEHAPPCMEHYFNLAEPYQFHLNAAGMGFCRVCMRRTAMTYEAEPHASPKWPFSSIEDWVTADQRRRDAYNKAERAASAQTVPGQIGIPEFKFLSNGPWLVSAREVQQALDRYDAAPSDLRADLESDTTWRDWLEWLRETTNHGGFAVP